jgi:hypothetical protein
MTLIYNSLYICNRNPWKFKNISYSEMDSLLQVPVLKVHIFINHEYLNNPELHNYFNPINKL